LTTREATERHQALVVAGYVPAVATPGLDPATTKGIDQWWGDHFVTAEYRASGEGFPQMPDDFTPGMGVGHSLSGHRRTHRVKYRGEDLALRMPSAAAVKRFALNSGDTTFDVPVGAAFPDPSGAEQFTSGWVRVTKGAGGRWTAVGMGFPAGGDEAVAEAVSAVVEARRPSFALRDAGSLIERHRARLAAQGAPLQPVSSQWISAIGYDAASGVMATQTANGHVYGHLVSKARFNAVAEARSPGAMFNRVIKGSERMEVARCEGCGRFYSSDAPHSCPTPAAPAPGVVRNTAQLQYAAKALSARAGGPVHQASPPVRVFGQHTVDPTAKRIDLPAKLRAGLAERREKFGLYGPPGWTIDTVGPAVGGFTSSQHVPYAYRELMGSTYENGSMGLVRFAGMGSDQAQVLLGSVSRKQLAERQNESPTLGAILTSAADHPGRVEVLGYVVGPDRSDERLTADGVFVYDDTITDEATAWETIRSRYGLRDAGAAEVHREENPWRPGEKAWRLWWD
jgi:hypothetical protein